MFEALAFPQPQSILRNTGRGPKAHKKAAVRPLARIWAERICNSNKDVKLFLVGAQGSGKSRSSLHLGIRAGEEIAKIKGGTWEDYFPRDLSQVFVGDPESHADALKHIKKNHIYILDDAGVSINARNFMTNYNKSLNDIFQTVRTDNAIIIINAPDNFLIDNVPRSIVSHYGEVSESQHADGYNFIKIFKMERKFREGKTHYHHYQFGNDQVIRWRFRDIPEDMGAAYEKLRDAATQRIKSHAGEDREAVAKEARMSKRQERAQKMEEAYLYAYTKYNEGENKSNAVALANQMFPEATIHRNGFYNWMLVRGFLVR